MSRHRRAILLASLAPCLLILARWVLWLDVPDARLFGFGKPPRWYVSVAIGYRALEVSFETNPMVGLGGVVEGTKYCGGQRCRQQQQQPEGEQQEERLLRPGLAARRDRPDVEPADRTPTLGLTPVLWQPMRARRRLQRLRRGRICPVCGYDLRASPDRCPECGAPAAAVSG